jgi:AcrR family transcriptional regulator
MGRPKEHDERTAAALLDAAEHFAHKGGIDALSLRELALEAGTTTRAVYSLFGSKDGLVAALGARAFELLELGLEALPVTDDPQRDLVRAGLMFRRFALDHPALFSIGVQRIIVEPDVWPHFRPAARSALAVLQARVQTLADAGLLGDRSVVDATLQFHALCEGLAAVELRGIPSGAERVWREGLHALIVGFAKPVPSRRRARTAVTHAGRSG